MNKRISIIILSLLMIFVMAATAGANPGKGLAKGHEKKAQQQIKVKAEVKELYKKENKIVKNQASKKQFVDATNHWANNSIERLSKAGIFKGYPDNTFKPDSCITQAEVVSLIMRLAADEELELIDNDEVEESKLKDIPQWAKEDAKKAANFKVINLNRFHSHMQASRAETAVWIAKALGLSPVDTSDMPFKDGILISPEDVGYILALYEEEIIFGNPNGKFNPNSSITRAEMAAIMERLLEKDQDKTIKSIDLPATATVTQGKSITLKATVNYSDGSSDNNVTWISDDTSLATVKDGIVTANNDKVGVVNITATAEKNDSSKSATCKVTIVKLDEVIEGTLQPTGKIGTNNGKVYEEYALKVDEEIINLDKDNVTSITLALGDDKPVTLKPNSDTTLWFNVQKETATYKLTVVDLDNICYEATLNWKAPIKISATTTGNEGENEGQYYEEYKLGSLDLSSFTKMYQIKPNGTVSELRSNTDSNLWFKTSNQIIGEHIFLIKIDGKWYTSTIDFN